MDPVIKKYNPGGVDEGGLRRTGEGGLLSGGYLREDPITSYLGSEESAVFVVSNRKSGVEYEHEKRDETRRIRPGAEYRAFAVATDSRLLFLIGDNRSGSGDHSVSVPLADLAVVEEAGGLLAGELVVVTSAGVRWRFATRDDLGPVADYLEAASTTWTRVEARLESARTRLVDATGHLESTAYGDAMAAVRDAMAETDAARRRERRFCGDGVHAIDARIERVEDRIRDVRVRVLRARARHHADAAETHWRTDAYDDAYRAYSDAQDDYREALSLVEPDATEAAEFREQLARIEDNTSYLRRAPIDRAETAEGCAEDADGPGERARYLERALERYRTALALDWGEDVKRFECDTDAVRERIDDVAADLVAARRTEAAEHERAGDEHSEAGRYREARERYRAAAGALRAGHDVARELVPGDAGELADRIDAVDERLAGVESRLGAPATEPDPQDPQDVRLY